MTNDQAPMTKQIQSINEEVTDDVHRSFRSLVLGYSCLFGHWSLVLGDLALGKN